MLEIERLNNFEKSTNTLKEPCIFWIKIISMNLFEIKKKHKNLKKLKEKLFKLKMKYNNKHGEKIFFLDF